MANGLVISDLSFKFLEGKPWVLFIKVMLLDLYLILEVDGEFPRRDPISLFHTTKVHFIIKIIYTLE